MGAPNLNTGYNTYQPLSFVVSRQWELFGFNGIERGFRWNGISAAADLAGIDAPSAAPTCNAGGAGALTAGDYTCAYRFVERKPGQLGADRYSNLSDLTVETAAGSDKMVWSGLSASSQSRVTFVELFRSTVGDASVLYLVARIGSSGSITGAANNGGTFRFTVPTGHNLIVGASITISGATGAGAGAVNATHTVTATTATTIDVATAYTADASGGTWVLAGYTADDDSDATISDDTAASYLALPVTNADGSLNAYRFVPPPNDRLAAVRFQDRGWFGGVVLYSQGTVSATNGSATVTSSGANLRAEMAGRFIAIEDDSRAYLISSINEGTGDITLTENHDGNLSGKAYTIYPDPATWDSVYYTEVDELESASTTNEVAIQTNVVDCDRLVGLMPFGRSMFCLKERHIYELTFQRQPKIDANVGIIAYRGAFNHRCWDMFEGTAFLMDQMGCYAIDVTGAWKPISQPIHDIWRDGTIDFTKSKWFWVKVDPNERCVYFHVAYSGDTGTYTKRWLKYSIDDGQWMPGGGVHQLGHGCQTELSGRVRILQGSENDQIYLAGEGSADHIATAVRCPVVSGSGTTLVVTKAGISSNDWQHASVAIVDGVGRRQIRKVASNGATSGGNVTITLDVALTTACAAGDVALIGAIECIARTKTYELPGGGRGEHLRERSFTVDWTPTANDAQLNVRTYWDADAAAQVYERGRDRGDGYKLIEGTSELVIPLAKDAPSGEGMIPGSVLVEMEGLSQARGHANRSFDLELTLYQGEEQVWIDGLEVEGAK